MQGRLGTTLALWNNFAPYILPYFWKCTMAHFESKRKRQKYWEIVALQSDQNFVAFSICATKDSELLIFKILIIAGPGTRFTASFLPPKVAVFLPLKTLWVSARFLLLLVLRSSVVCTSSKGSTVKRSTTTSSSILYYYRLCAESCRWKIRKISVGIYTNNAP